MSPDGPPCGAVGTPQPHDGEQDRPDVAEQRAAWHAEQGAMSRGRLIFIDQTGASTKPSGAVGSPRPHRDGPALRSLPPRPTARRGPPALRGLPAAFASGIG